jgi:uncharacterized protein (TIGR03643 family)
VSLPPDLTEGDVSRVIQMAREDRTTFDTIEQQFGLNESAVVRLMRRELLPISFKMWRQRMAGRVTKHSALRDLVMPHRDTQTADHRRPNC